MATHRGRHSSNASGALVHHGIAPDPPERRRGGTHSFLKFEEHVSFPNI